jgi:glycosidase
MNYPFTAATIAYAVGDRLDPATRLDNADYSVAPAIDGSAYRDRIEWILSWYNDAAAASNLNLLDSHDTARILTIASGDVDSVVLSLVLLLTFPGAPSIYYGDEVGLEGGLDPDSRRGFPWDHEERWNRRILDATKELIALRRAHPALRSTDYRVLWPLGSGDGSMAYAFERRSEDDRVVVVINAGDARESQAVPYPTLDAHHADLLWGDAEVALGEKQMRVSMAPRSAAIWELT